MTRDKVAAVMSPFLVLVHTVVKILGEIVDGTALHRGVAHEEESLARGLVIYLEGANIGVIAAFLRTYIFIVFVADIGGVSDYKLNIVAV